MKRLKRGVASRFYEILPEEEIVYLKVNLLRYGI
jgi:hypothetical protein